MGGCKMGLIHHGLEIGESGDVGEVVPRLTARGAILICAHLRKIVGIYEEILGNRS